MTGCCGHHAPVREAPRSPGELTPAGVRWRGERLSWGNLLETGPGSRVNGRLGISRTNEPEAGLRSPCQLNGPSRPAPAFLALRAPESTQALQFYRAATDCVPRARASTRRRA